ncbi:MAG: hypothetical protein CMJ43_13385 [Phyllobacteriaceae bacterium]|nr:hypothetical protein [Phyllobacteriaceae bacterium]
MSTETIRQPAIEDEAMTISQRRNVNRRRVLFIGAALAGAALVSPALAASSETVAQWRGIALGADATLQLAGVTQAQAAPVFHAVEQEISRLEQVFSLYRGDSALMRLNAAGVLETPPQEMLALLGQAHAAWLATDGLFDPTVQPLFQAMAEHYTSGRTGRPTLDAALSRVGFDKVHFDADAVRFARPGMAMTFNGIAQGYLTDRVTALLRAQGFDNVLVDLGEIRALGPGRHGGGWRVGLARPGASAAMPHLIDVRDRAVATSAMLGTTFDQAGKAGHILHPLHGIAPVWRKQVTVLADNATQADALSTAATLMDDAGIDRLRAKGVTVLAYPDKPASA